RGTIRIGLPTPANAAFTLTAVDDPYHYASAAELSLFRRPLVPTNLAFLSDVMWDGRFSIPGQSLAGDLATQGTKAVLGHEQGLSPPTPAQLAEIINFERNLYTTQYTNTNALDLTAAGATGGAQN